MFKADRIIAVVLVLIGVLWIMETRRFNQVVSFLEVGQNVLPMVAGIGLIICGIWMIILLFTSHRDINKSTEKSFTREILIRIGISLALMSIYIVMTPVLGFTSTTFLFILVYLLWQKYSWWKSFLMSLGVAVVFVIVFQNYLSMSLPVGLVGF